MHRQRPRSTRRARPPSKGVETTRWPVAALALALALGACTEDRVIGERCPSPYLPDGGATFARGVGPAEVYGTSCAPCDDSVRLDARGCPIYVSFESCGGDICVGRVRVRQVVPDGGQDAGPEEDAGEAEQDGGTSQEDAGAD